MAAPATPNGKTVLIVEDDVSLRRMVVKHLEKLGYSVTDFDNGEDALAHVEKQAEPPSLVCLDVALPAMSGFRVCESLRSTQKTRHVPVIILTARTTVQDHTFALEVGADAFLEKPFKLKDLETEISKLLRGSR